MINKIKDIVSVPLQEVEKELNDSFHSDITEVNQLLCSTLKSGGKRVRPVLLILVAKMLGYEGSLTYKIGALIENIHTSSILHDDVIDNADARRGIPSANKVYGNSIAVLAGDFLYTSVFRRIVDLPDKEFAYILTNAVSNMSQGEILQLIKTGSLDITFNEYMKIINRKTGALFAAATECAAILGNVSSNSRRNLKEFGENIGYAFQLKDDVLDYYGTEEVLGKKPGTDLEEMKVTLPIILLIEAMGRHAVNEFFNKSIPNEEKLSIFLELFLKYDIKAKALSLVDDYVDAAIRNLNDFDESIYKSALLSISEFLRYRVS